MSRGVMVYWSWRMAPSWDGLVTTNHSREGACVRHRLSMRAQGEPRTTEPPREERGTDRPGGGGRPAHAPGVPEPTPVERRPDARPRAATGSHRARRPT